MNMNDIDNIRAIQFDVYRVMPSGCYATSGMHGIKDKRTTACDVYIVRCLPDAMLHLEWPNSKDICTTVCDVHRATRS